MHRKLSKFIRREPRVAGFTITEVVIASALLIIAIVPILKALTVSHVSGTAIERKTRSLILAQAKLDEIRARSIYNYTGTFTELSTSLDGPYMCIVHDASSELNLRKVGVAVGCDLSGNNMLETQEVEVVLTTFIARRL